MVAVLADRRSSISRSTAEYIPVFSPWSWAFGVALDINALGREESKSGNKAGTGVSAVFVYPSRGNLRWLVERSVTCGGKRQKRHTPTRRIRDAIQTTEPATGGFEDREPAPMTNEELLSPEHWRVFRLFLGSLSDEELDYVEDQLKKEQLARQERETIIVRLFYGSMSAQDLDAAGQQICWERQARAEDQRILRESASARTTTGRNAVRKKKRRVVRPRG